MTTFNQLLQQLEEYSDQLVSIFTLGQLPAIKDSYLTWFTSASVSSPDVFSYLLAGLFVILRFCLPLIFVGFLLTKVTKNLYILISGVGLTVVLYTYLYFDPYTTFIRLSHHIQGFREYLATLPSMETDPFLFTFLTNGLIVFIIQMIVSFLGSWVFFAVVVALSTFIVMILTGGKDPWSITDKSFKYFTLQATLVFLIFYAVFGSFKGIVSTFILMVGSVNILHGLRTVLGYEKYCYTMSDGRIVCKWVKR